MIVFNFNQSVWKTDHDCSIRVEGVPFYFSRFTNLVILWSILAVACIAFTLRLVFQAFWINFADTAHVFSTIVSIAQFLTYDLNHVPFFTWKSCFLLRINGTWQTVVFSCMVKHWHVMLKRCLHFCPSLVSGGTWYNKRPYSLALKKILGLKGLSALGRIGAKLGAIKSSLKKVKLSNISYTANAF